MPNLIINKFKGLNSTVASLQLQPGEFQFTQNFRGRPYDNFAKRQGVEPVSVQTSPVMGIFEYALDGIIIPVIDSGGSLTFQADTSSPSFPTLPDIYPSVTPPIDPNGDRTVLFNVEQTMRAIQDRRVQAGHSAWVWPNLIFASNGTLLNGNTGIAVSSYPANNLYGPDLTYHDIYYGHPIGTRAASLVNSIIDACIDTVNLNDWINMTTGIEGQSSVTLYTSSIFPTASSATRSTYKSVLTSCKTGIRKLSAIQRFPTQVNKETKAGVGGPTNFCTLTLDSLPVFISPFSTSMFDDCGHCQNSITVTGDWDGTGFIGPNSSAPCKWVLPAPVSSGPGVNGCAVNSATISGVSSGTTQTLRIDRDGTGGFAILWIGTKVDDGSPLGVFTNSGTGCSTIPATITISM